MKKFKIFDQERKKWVYFTLSDLVNINPESTFGDSCFLMQRFEYDYSDEDVCEFTGFYAMGEEVYENDIVEIFVPDETGEFLNEEHGLVMKDEDNACWVIKNPKTGKMIDINANYYVIGNIIEDPDFFERVEQ